VLLSIDTSTRYGGVALHRDGALLVSHCWRSTGNHTAELMPAVEAALKSVAARPRDLTGIALALGPGGFSALRVGMSAAKGLALSLGVPLVGVKTLEMEAYPYAATGLSLCPALPLGKEEVAWALYQSRRGRWLQRGDEQLGTPAELAAQLLEAAARLPRTRTPKQGGTMPPTSVGGAETPPGILLCGEAAPVLAQLVKRKHGSRVAVAATYTPTLRLEALAALALRRLSRGERDDLASLQPFYLRRPSIGVANPPRPIR